MRIALPKGRLQGKVLGMLEQIGIGFAFGGDRDYTPACTAPHITAKLLKVRAIPQMIALGNFDAGFCGLDLVREAGYDEVVPLLDLELNPVELVVAVSAGREDIVQNPPGRPLVIATEYENIADRWALEHNLAHITVQTWGSTEAYAPEDADIVFDCTETGRTLEANGLVVIDKIMRSSTQLVANRFALDRPDLGEQIENLRRELEALTP